MLRKTRSVSHCQFSFLRQKLKNDIDVLLHDAHGFIIFAFAVEIMHLITKFGIHSVMIYSSVKKTFLAAEIKRKDRDIMVQCNELISVDLKNNIVFPFFRII